MRRRYGPREKGETPAVCRSRDGSGVFGDQSNDGPQVSTFNHAAIATRLTSDRLGSYLAVVGGDVERAVDLYDWNTAAGGALHEDIGRLEVVFRNAVDESLGALHDESVARRPSTCRRVGASPGHGLRLHLLPQAGSACSTYAS